MKSIYNKILLGAAAIAASGMVSCVNDLDQLPKDPNVIQAPTFAENPKEYLGEVMAKCYSALAVSGQSGANGDSDIKGLDGGTSQWTRGLFMLNEFPTDECMWVYQDAGVPDLVQANWGSDNVVVYGIYSRFYTHIAICNDFLRLVNDLGANGISVDAELQKEIDQFKLEARALRGLSYYNVVDLWGRGVVAWDDMAYGQTPPQAESREALFNKVVEDLEDVLASWPDNQSVVYGRIGKDAVEALLCRYYLNSEVWTGTPAFDKCWTHAQNIINRHKGGGFQGSGLANDYLSLFCRNNHMFMPGGSLSAQNEILWGIPYETTYTEPWGGTTFLVYAPIKNAVDNPLDAGFCDVTYYGVSDGWGCLHARQQFCEKFDFVNGYSTDGRTYIWLTENAGYTVGNTDYSNYTDGYIPMKFTNVVCNSDGSMPKWVDPLNGLPRIGVQPVTTEPNHPSNDLPLIRLADVYLMAAECTLHGAGDKATGVEYVNLVRARSGVAPWSSIDLTADNILDERARELYWEMTRRTDLIRFNKFTSGYNWNWKNNIYSGTPIADYRKLYPLPANVTAVYGASMIQNPGY